MNADYFALACALTRRQVERIRKDDTMDPIIIAPETLTNGRYIATCATCTHFDTNSDSLDYLVGWARNHVERTGHTMTVTERALVASAPDCHAITGG